MITELMGGRGVAPVSVCMFGPIIGGLAVSTRPTDPCCGVAFGMCERPIGRSRPHRGRAPDRIVVGTVSGSFTPSEHRRSRRHLDGCRFERRPSRCPDDGVLRERIADGDVLGDVPEPRFELVVGVLVGRSGARSSMAEAKLLDPDDA
nr:hypothetical protein [Natrinema salaciae]